MASNETGEHPMVLVEYESKAGVGRIGRLLHGIGVAVGGSRDPQRFFSKVVGPGILDPGKVVRISRPQPIPGASEPEIERLTRLAVEAGFDTDEISVQVSSDDYWE